MHPSAVKWARRLVPRGLRQQVRDWHTQRLWQLDLDKALALVEARVRKRNFRAARDLTDALLVRHPRDPRLVEVSRSLSGAYDDHFYAGHSTGSLNSARVILSILSRHTGFTRVVDVGAGIGTWLAAASELGAAECIAVEGEWVRDAAVRNARCQYVFQDLNQPLKVSGRFDCAICVEVAEHLNPERGPSLIQELCSLSGLVLFAAALPRQRGSGHINCRPHEYWVRLFGQNGYACLDAIRPETWNNPRVEAWYAQNAFAFVSRERSDLLSTIPRATLLSVYHPALMNHLVLADYRAGETPPDTSGA